MLRRPVSPPLTTNHKLTSRRREIGDLSDNDCPPASNLLPFPLAIFFFPLSWWWRTKKIKKMYGGLLLAHPSVAERELPDLPHASSSAASSTKEEEGVEMWAAVMLLVDTTGCDMPEEDAGGGSRRNEREAEVAVRHVK